MIQAPNGNFTGIYEHHKIRENFVFALDIKKSMCPFARLPVGSKRACTDMLFYVQIQNIVESRDTRKCPSSAFFVQCFLSYTKLDLNARVACKKEVHWVLEISTYFLFARDSTNFFFIRLHICIYSMIRSFHNYNMYHTLYK